MISKHLDIGEFGFLVVKFNTVSKAGTLELAKAFRLVLTALHAKHVGEEIDIVIDADGGTGKTTFCEKMLGVEICAQEPTDNQNSVDWLLSWHGESLVRTSRIYDLGTVVWMDAFGLYMDQIDNKSTDEENITDPCFHRHSFDKDSGLQGVGGVNVVEHPEYCSNISNVKCHISLVKQWDDYYEPRSNSAPRDITFSVSPEVYKSEVFQGFLVKVQYLNPQILNP